MVNVGDFLPGLCQGLVRVLVSYPFDFVRLKLQTDKSKTAFGAVRGDNVYRGLGYPLAAVPFDRAVSFFLFERLKKSDSILVASLLPSIISGLYMTPINMMNANVIHHGNFEHIRRLAFYRGFGIEVFRHTTSSFLFLYSYGSMYGHVESPFVCGGLASIVMWTVMYPVDTIKARRFVFGHGYRALIASTSMRGAYSGVSLVYARTFPSAGVGMAVYEYVKDAIAAPS